MPAAVLDAYSHLETIKKALGKNQFHEDCVDHAIDAVSRFVKDHDPKSGDLSTRIVSTVRFTPSHVHDTTSRRKNREQRYGESRAEGISDSHDPHDLREDLLAAIASLPDDLREFMTAYHSHGCHLSNTCDFLHMSKRKTPEMLSRAFAIMRSYLEDYE